MSDKEIFVAFVLDAYGVGSQLLRYEFEHPIVEYWAEPEEQEKLKDYFQQRTAIKDRPIVVEKSETLVYYPHKEQL